MVHGRPGLVSRAAPALDREGGSAIAIDYLLITPHTMLNDDAVRSEFLSGLDGLPYDNCG